MTAGLGGRKTEGQQVIKDENGNLLRDKGGILRRWERFFGNLLNTKSPALQPSIVEKVQQRRKAPPPPPPGARSQIGEPISLEAEPTYAETQQAVRAIANWKAPGAGADSLPVELLKLDDPTLSTSKRSWFSRGKDRSVLESEPEYKKTQVEFCGGKIVLYWN